MRSQIVAGMLTLVMMIAIGAGYILSRSFRITPVAPRPAVFDPTIAAPDPSRPVGPGADSGGPFVDNNLLEDGGLGVAVAFTGTIRDPNSLADLRDAVLSRGRLGLAALSAEVDRPADGPNVDPAARLRAVKARKDLGLLHMYSGDFDAASKQITLARDLGILAKIPPRASAEMDAILGIIALRRGEVENCIACAGPSSCIFPIAPEAAHKQQEGSRRAIHHFQTYLKKVPGDLRIRWALNLAHMTLGEYPDKVPPDQLIPIDIFRSKADIGRFPNVILKSGLASRGPNMAGGSIFDDFNGDGLPDLFTTSLDADRGASLFLNKGDGTFADHSDKAGLPDQVYVLNVARADYDNDGDLDLFLMRGAWESPMRPTLLRNKGDGTFEDVTIAAGMSEPISTESASWGDYDNDGLVDLFVCGEYFSPIAGASSAPDPRNRCRLYHNRGDGTFEDVAASAGVSNSQCAKGSSWGDYDGDGRIDLFVSNMGAPCRLYHNEGAGKFRDVAPELGVTGPDRAFACWFFDYDNDGRPDLFVNDYALSLASTAASALGLRSDRPPSRPRLYRNLGPDGFRDVAPEVGLDRGIAPMGCNFADVDNDGFLDLYFGTGGMSYEYLVPNVFLRNVAGKTFEDITLSSATGHLQKGHGVSFADYDSDGDLDLFVEAGGAVPGDSSHNLLFQNPGHNRHWLDVRLIGTKCNRSALGAHLLARITLPDGTARTLHRTVGDNSSFGGNSLVEHLGLGPSARLSELTVTWPDTRASQTFRDLEADQTLEITQGTDTPRVVRPARPNR